MLARSVERLAERFEHNSQELIARLRVEHDRLEAIAGRREKEFADFGVFASGMRAGAEETHRLLIELRQVSTSLAPGARGPDQRGGRLRRPEQVPARRGDVAGTFGRDRYSERSRGNASIWPRRPRFWQMQQTARLPARRPLRKLAA